MLARRGVEWVVTQAFPPATLRRLDDMERKIDRDNVFDQNFPVNEGDFDRRSGSRSRTNGTRDDERIAHVLHMS